MTYRLVEHETAEKMATTLAARVALALEDAVASHRRAGLAVPGGSTPEAFLNALADSPIEWERIGVTLTDERWVPTSDPRSNQALLARTLFRGPAASAEFVPLYGATAELEDGLAATEAALERIVLPLDVAVVGMGEDGHTASLFPGATGLEAGLAGSARVVAIRAPGLKEPRISLSAPVLAEARHLYLMIRGDAKRRMLERAAGADPHAIPVAALLDRAEVHWAP